MWCARWAWLVQTLVPLTSQPPSVRRAAVRTSGRALQVLVADGLGHGAVAARAAHQAVAEFVARDHATPERAVQAIHGALRSTRGAAGTKAFQTNRNLVLAEGARADSVPNIEIDENDVRCSHAAKCSRA